MLDEVSLLYKPLDSITAADLQGLIDNQVPESPYIEYKLEVFDKRDDKKRLQFLGSISGFSNGVGGDLLIGVKAVNGIPVELVGLEQAEADGETLRIQQIVGTSIEPQVRMTIRPIFLPNGRTILIIRLPQSWTAPHGIKKNDHYCFYRRNSAGRSPMTIPELRTSFSLTSTIAEHTRRFRAQRLTVLRQAQWGFPYRDEPLVVLHLVPFSSGFGTLNVDIASLRNLWRMSPHKKENGCVQEGDVRYNLDGVLMHVPDGATWHTQLFRDGSIEHATTHWTGDSRNQGYIDAFTLQVTLVNILPRFLGLQLTAGVTPPVTAILSLLNVANFKLNMRQGMLYQELSDHQIDREELLLPEVIVEDFKANPKTILKPVFDSLWNAAGMKNCPYYKDSGEWPLDESWIDRPEEKAI